METMTLEELRDTCAKCAYTQSVEAIDAAIRERDELRGTRESKEKAAMRAGGAPDPANTRTLGELLRDSDILRRRGIVEIAEVNASVADYCRHWEQRAEKAESALAALRKRIADAKLVSLGAYPAHGGGLVEIVMEPTKGLKHVRLLAEDNDV